MAIIFAIALYLTGLTRMGMFSTDEPRYAAIGRAMAATGDWITPTLWGQKFFEKPALLYWMTAAGFKLGLGPDLAPRLPLALLSVSFLVFFRTRLRHVFDETVANYATAMLATSAGWLAYSHVAVTDLPMSAFFSAALLLAMPDKEGNQPHRIAAAIALALAVLAKSVPPLVLFLPVLALDHLSWRRWFLSWPIAAFLLVALPWHVLATLRNGWNFPYVLFVQQQLNRFLTDAPQHVQPWWFYGPVFLLLLFPWFPLLPLAIRHVRDLAIRPLAAVVITGLIFFSASLNKLPGYVLPLVPATCVLAAFALVSATHRERWLIAPIALLGALPLAASVLPESAAHGLKSASISWILGAYGLITAAAVACIIARWFRSAAFPLAILFAAIGFCWVETSVFPALDQAASARALWSANHPECTTVVPRATLYGLYYYSGKVLPDCAIVDKDATSSDGRKTTTK